MIDEDNLQEIHKDMAKAGYSYTQMFGKVLPFPNLEIESIDVNPITPDSFTISKKRVVDPHNFYFVNYVNKEDLNNFIDTYEDIRDGDDFDPDTDDGFELTIQQMRMQGISNIDEKGQVKDESSLKFSARVSAEFGGLNSAPKVVNIDGKEYDIKKVATSIKASDSSVLKKATERRARLSSVGEAFRESEEDEEQTSSLESIEEDDSSEGEESEEDSDYDSDEDSSSRERSGESSSRERSDESYYSGEGESGSGSREDSDVVDEPSSSLFEEGGSQDDNLNNGVPDSSPNLDQISPGADKNVGSSQGIANSQPGMMSGPAGYQPAAVNASNLPNNDPRGQNLATNPLYQATMNLGGVELTEDIKDHFNELLLADEEEQIQTEIAPFVPVKHHLREYSEGKDAPSLMKTHPRSMLFGKCQNSGYYIERKIYNNNVPDTPRHKFYSSCGKYFGMICKKTLIIWDLKDKDDLVGRSVSIKSKFFPKGAVFHLSHNAKWLCARQKFHYVFFDVSTGEMTWEKKRDEDDYYAEEDVFFGFISETKLIGVPSKQVPKRIFTLDVSYPNSSVDDIRDNLDYNHFSFDPNGKGCIAEHSRTLYYIYLDRSWSNNQDEAMLTGYDRILKKNVTHNRSAVMFEEEGKIYFALFNKAQQLWRTNFDLFFEPVNPAVYANESNEIIFYEKPQVSSDKKHKVSPQIRSKIFTIDKNGFSEINFSTNVKFHYPYIFYIYDNNEIWLQKVQEPNVIHRFAMVNSVTAVDYIDDVHMGKYSKKAECSFTCMLTYQNVHKIAEFTFNEYPKTINLGGELFPTEDNEDFLDKTEKVYETFVMDRFKKGIKFSPSLPDNIISMAVLKIGSGSDFFVMFHCLNRLEFYDSRRESVVKKLPFNLGKRNIIKFDASSEEDDKNSSIFLWQDNGRFIERLILPSNPGDTTFTTQKAYNAFDKIKMCKKVFYEKEGKLQKALLICDEKASVKILAYNQLDNIFDVEKKYFVHSKFGAGSDLDHLNSYNTASNILYNNYESYVMQPWSRASRHVLIKEEKLKFDRKVLSFPLCSDNFVLRQINAKESFDYKAEEGEAAPKIDCRTLLLTPPLNSHKILHSIRKKQADIEYFIEHPTKPQDRIIRIFEEEEYINIELYSIREFNPLDSEKWEFKDIVDGNPGEFLDMQYNDKDEQKKYEVVVSPNGNNV